MPSETHRPPWPRTRLTYPREPFHAAVERAAQMRPEKIAVSFEDRVYTYRELDSLSNTIASVLVDRGVRVGDRVALYLENRPEWIVSLLAISKAGGAAVLMSAVWRETELAHAMALTRPVAVITDPAGARVVDAQERPGLALRMCVDGAAPDGWSEWPSLLETASTVAPSIDVDPASELALPFSSGTTGMPKAVRHSHANAVTASLQWQTTLGLDETDSIQIFTPLQHILGVLNLGAALASRGHIRLIRRFDAQTVLECVEADRTTIIVAVAPVARTLADFEDLERFDLSSLRYLTWSATPVDLLVANRFTERTGVRWMQTYGTTEVPLLFSNPCRYPDHWRLDSPGLTVSDVQARVIDPQTGTDVEPGESGELVVRSPAAMLGYLPEESNAGAWIDTDWYRTGDLAELDRDGWLTISDRLKDIIRVSGYQVAPAEIESVLASHPAVADCLVFGVRHETKGQVPYAAVVLRDGLPPESVGGVEEWASAQLAPYKRLVGVVVLDEIPRTASGKGLRRVLSEKLAEGAPRSWTTDSR